MQIPLKKKKRTRREFKLRECSIEVNNHVPESPLLKFELYQIRNYFKLFTYRIYKDANNRIRERAEKTELVFRNR